MEPEGSLPFSQQHVTCPYLSQMHPVQNVPPYFPKLLPSGYLTKNISSLPCVLHAPQISSYLI